MENSEGFQIHVRCAADKELCKKINAVLHILQRAYLGRIVHITKGNGYQSKGNANTCFVNNITVGTGSATGCFRLQFHIQLLRTGTQLLINFFVVGRIVTDHGAFANSNIAGFCRADATIIRSVGYIYGNCNIRLYAACCEISTVTGRFFTGCCYGIATDGCTFSSLLPPMPP